jgi:hypothetical protein
MAEKVDVLVHIETPGLSEILSLLLALPAYSFRSFSDVCEIENHSGLLIAGFRQYGQIPLSYLPRLLLVGVPEDVQLLVEGQWLKKGLCDAQLLPLHSELFLAKVDQLVCRTRTVYITDTIRTVQGLYRGSLSPKEIRILELLLQSGRDGVTRQEFGDGVWPGLSVHSKTLDTHLFNLRSKVEEFGLNIVWHRDQQAWRLQSTNPRVHVD